MTLIQFTYLLLLSIIVYGWLVYDRMYAAACALSILMCIMGILVPVREGKILACQYGIITILIWVIYYIRECKPKD